MVVFKDDNKQAVEIKKKKKKKTVEWLLEKEVFYNQDYILTL